jgi:hypothetical protein
MERHRLSTLELGDDWVCGEVQNPESFEECILAL